MITKTATNRATIDTEKLREVLKKANLISQNRGLPVLSDVLVEFANGKAIFTTTDLEKVILIEIDSDSDETFSILLPKKLTEKFLQGANGRVLLTKQHGQIVISRSGLGSISATADNINDFPPNLPKPPNNLKWHSLDGKWFCSMLRIVATACAEEGERPIILTGVAYNDGAIAAADGFRLVVLKDNRLAFGLKNKHVVIPLATVNLIVKLFRKEDTLEVAFEIIKDLNNYGREMIKHIYLKSNNVMLVSELIQGNFPQYEQLIPTQFKCKASFSAPLLLQRLNMIDPTAINSGIIRYTFETLETKEQVCSISATIGEEDKYHLSCPVKFEGDEAKIAFNYKYMVEALKPFSMCNFEITSPSSPGKLTGDIEGLTVVIMPMFVEW